MPWVNLKRAWFAHNGAFYEPAGNPHDFPEDWPVPSTAEILKPPEVVPAPPAVKGKKVVEEVE